MTAYIGVDPGLKGAIALIDEVDEFYAVVDMPLTPYGRSKMINPGGIANWCRIMADGHDIDRAVIEIPQMRSGGHSAQSMRTTWFNYGRLTMTFEKWDEVEAAVWKKAMGVTKDKKTSIALARKLFPSVAHELTDSKDGRSEALLIAEYARRMA
jgi:hypothetical protein